MVDYGENNNLTSKINKDHNDFIEDLIEDEQLAQVDEDLEELEDFNSLEKVEKEPLSEEDEFYLNNYPIIAITGNFGAGKTLLATFLALTYKANHNMNIFSNYKFVGVDYRKVTFEEVAKMPDWLRNGVLVLDEMQIGADSYNSMGKNVKLLTTFITQIRKRDIILVITTQRFKMVAKRIRLLINYYIEVESVAKGVIKARTYDLPNGYILLNTKTYNLKAVYPFYDTTEVIRNESQ